MALSVFAWGTLLVAAACVAAGAYLLLKLRHVPPAPTTETAPVPREE